MGQMGFFDMANRYAGLDANDPLVRIGEVVSWEDFRPRLEAAWRRPAEERKSPAGRKPWDAAAKFKAIVLCALYNLSDDQVEYQLRDRALAWLSRAFLLRLPGVGRRTGSAGQTGQRPSRENFRAPRRKPATAAFVRIARPTRKPAVPAMLPTL